MRTLGLALLAALVVVASGGPASGRVDAGCNTVILLEPSHTRGRSNTIRWERVPSSCWENDDVGGKKSTERRFVVKITNANTNAKATVTVHGDGEVDATIDPAEFPGGAALVDGQRFTYSVVRKERVCISAIASLCELHDTWTYPYSNTVTSTQDDRAPSGSLVLAGGRAFVRALDVQATVSATDPGGAAGSGAGYVSFGSLAPRGGCGPVAGCAEPLGPTLTVRLAQGPDGQRTIEARAYDNARGPADDPGATTIGTPPGNVSAPFQDTVYLDRTAPAIFIRLSTVRIVVGAPVTFDASPSVDPPEGSGLQPVTGAWSFGDGGSATGLVATHTYTRTGRFPFTFAVADNVGNIARTEGEIEVLAAPVPAQPGTTEKPAEAPRPTTVDRQPPMLSALSARRRGALTTVAFRVSERAVVRVEVRRVRPRPLRRTASLSRRLAAGRRGIVLPAAATRTPGRYAIVLVARDAAGNSSKPRTLTLTKR